MRNPEKGSYKFIKNLPYLHIKQIYFKMHSGTFLKIYTFTASGFYMRVSFFFFICDLLNLAKGIFLNDYLFDVNTHTFFWAYA